MIRLGLYSGNVNRGLEWILPTFDEASVKLLSVVDLPEEGLPTKPISGSRGMLAVSCVTRQWSDCNGQI